MTNQPRSFWHSSTTTFAAACFSVKRKSYALVEARATCTVPKIDLLGGMENRGMGKCQEMEF